MENTALKQNSVLVTDSNYQRMVKIAVSVRFLIVSACANSEHTYEPEVRTCQSSCPTEYKCLNDECQNVGDTLEIQCASCGTLLSIGNYCVSQEECTGILESVDTGVCQCRDGSAVYNPITKLCDSPCDEQCRADMCGDACSWCDVLGEKCTDCSNGLMDGNKCYATCPGEKKPDTTSKFCYNCHTDCNGCNVGNNKTHCKACNAINSQKMFLHPVTTLCSDTCPDGYYGKEGKCVTCDIGCAKCSIDASGE
jgi:hypothetical protein